MAQDLLNKHTIVEVSRVCSVYGDGHILSVEMDKDRDNGDLITIGEYKEGEYYACADFDGTGFSATVVEVFSNGNGTMVRFEVAADVANAYMIADPEYTPHDCIHALTGPAYYYNAKGERARCYPIKARDIWTVSVDAFGSTPTKGQTVTWTSTAGFAAA